MWFGRSLWERWLSCIINVLPELWRIHPINIICWYLALWYLRSREQLNNVSSPENKQPFAVCRETGPKKSTLPQPLTGLLPNIWVLLRPSAHQAIDSASIIQGVSCHRIQEWVGDGAYLKYSWTACINFNSPVHLSNRAESTLAIVLTTATQIISATQNL